MKKNYVIRISAIVLAFVIATASLVSGTFAKYTTSLYGTDSARVAYFEFGSDVLGETQETTIDLFSSWLDYNVAWVADPGGIMGSNYRNESPLDGKKLLAPGLFGGFNLNLWGKAEVDTQIDFDFDLATSENIPLVFEVIEPGSNYGSNDPVYHYYSDYYGAGDVVKVRDYRSDSGPNGTGEVTPIYSEITIEGNLQDMGDSMSFVLNWGSELTSLGILANVPEGITWFWAFEEEINGSFDERDVNDTALGNAAVDVTGDQYWQKEYAINDVTAKLDIKFTATQID